MNIKDKKIRLQEELDRRILYGLSCEWETSLWILPSVYRNLIKKPVFSLRDMDKRLGYWSLSKRQICLSREFVVNHPWDSVREVLRHEIAHQFVHEVFRVQNERAHGPAFQRACELLRANPKASGSYEPLDKRVYSESLREDDKILARVKKLMALAQSTNQHEAEAAMLKAHELIAKYNIDLMKSSAERDFISVFIGKPALRHFREEYMLTNILQDFYFIQGIWVTAYVLEKKKMGRVFEISGTEQNVRIAGYVYDFVHNFINAQWSSYNKDRGLNRYRKTDFAMGILEGFRIKLELQESSNVHYEESRSLVKTEDPLLHKYMNYRYPNIRTSRGNPLRQDPDIVGDGIKIGKKLVISKGITDKGEKGKYLPEK